MGEKAVPSTNMTATKKMSKAKNERKKVIKAKRMIQMKMLGRSSRKKDIVAITITNITITIISTTTVAVAVAVVVIKRASMPTFMAWDMFTQVKLPTMEVSTFLASEVSMFADQDL